LVFLFGRMIRGRSDNATLCAIEQCIIRGKNEQCIGKIGVIKPFGFTKISFWIELNKADNEQIERGKMPSRSKHRHRPAGTPRPRRPRRTRIPRRELPPRPPAAAPPRDAERGARHAAEHGHGEARAEHAARRRALRHRRAAPGGGVRGGRRRGHAGPAQASSTSFLPLLRGILLPTRRRRRLGVHAVALGCLRSSPCLAPCFASGAGDSRRRGVVGRGRRGKEGGGRGVGTLLCCAF